MIKIVLRNVYRTAVVTTHRQIDDTLFPFIIIITHL